MVDFRAYLDPIWGSKTEQEEPQEEPKSSQDEVAVENAAKSKTCVSPRRSSLFGFWGGPRRGPAEAKDAILQAKSLQKRGQKNGPQNVTNNDDKGTKMGPKMGPQNH